MKNRVAISFFTLHSALYFLHSHYGARDEHAIVRLRDAPGSPADPAVAQMRLYRIFCRAGALLLALVRADELPVLLRHVGLLHAGRNLARIAPARVHAGSRNSASPGAVDARF